MTQQPAQTIAEEIIDNRCRFCEQPVRWSTSYDEPHWVHIRIADTVSCPQYSAAGR